MSRIGNRCREVSVSLSKESKAKHPLISYGNREGVVDLALYRQRGLANLRILQIRRNRPDPAEEDANRPGQRDQLRRWLVPEAVQKSLPPRRPLGANIGIM